MAGPGRFSPKIFPGARFHRLVVVERIPGGNGKRAKVLCKCDCGKEVAVHGNDLTREASKSCGCLNKELMAQRARERSEQGYPTVYPGAVFHRLTVVERERNEQTGMYTNRVHCKCSCGKGTLSNIDGMVSGCIKSCGCYNSDNTAKRNRDTAKFNRFSALYPLDFNNWSSMISRCYRPRQNAYQYYGAKGVFVCPFFRESPENLVSLIGHRSEEKNTLDRYPIHDGNYTCGQCPECVENDWELNVRWASRKEQSNNRSNNVYLTAFGKTLTRGQWQDLTGIDEWRIHRRIHELGWSVEKALTTPDRSGNCYKPE